MSNEKLYSTGNLCSVITFAIIVRLAVSLHSYSGQNKPPLYGDYEAQRHWMEITVNLPLSEWYFNTSANDLFYWGLDYPPLTAYHSYVNGKIAGYINTDFVELLKSRGYESNDHKFFMRGTVLVTDLCIYIVSVVFFANSVYKKQRNSVELLSGEASENPKNMSGSIKNISISVTYLSLIAIILLYPGLILIDHGHFQYNSISLGFTILSITGLMYNKFVISSIFFCLALSYKQMSLYHSLPIFVYMLSNCLQFKKPVQLIDNVSRFLAISLSVIGTFTVIWFPFLTSKESFFQVLHRLFPIARGIFEDKVSNIWCAVNIFYKLHEISDKLLMAKICIFCVLISSVFSLINLFKNPTVLRLILSLINVSLSFFLFSYQVHEKSILLVSLPVLLYFPYDPLPCFWFLLISNFSMLPLFVKDNLLNPFISLNVLHTLFVMANVNFQPSADKKLSKMPKKWFSKRNISFFLNILFYLSLMSCVILFMCTVLIKPPARYPDLWPLLISVYSLAHFCCFGLYFNYVQIFKLVD